LAKLDLSDQWGHPAQRGIPEPGDLKDFEVPKATQEPRARRDRKAIRVTPAPPDRRVPPATLVQLASSVRTARRESRERWDLLGWRDLRATPEPLAHRARKAIRGQRDCEGHKAITESPGRKDLRVTRARSALRDPLVLRGFQVRREIPDLLGWPACRAQRAMPVREAQQDHRDSRGI
jgi:hypothetical protein